MPLISDHLKFMASVDIGDFQQLGYQEGSVSILSYFFSCFFLVCKLYIRSVNQACISSHILNMGNVLFEGFQYLVFQFLAFLSILNLLFLAIFPDLEMLKFWSVNYICQFCKLYFYFGYVRIYLALVKYMLCSHFTENCILLYFLEAKNPYFVTKNC